MLAVLFVYGASAFVAPRRLAVGPARAVRPPVVAARPAGAEAPRSPGTAGSEAVAAIRSAVAFAQIGHRGPAEEAARTAELQRCRMLSEVELRAVLVGRGVVGADAPEVNLDLLAELLAELRLAEQSRASGGLVERRSTTRRGFEAGRRRPPQGKAVPTVENTIASVLNSATVCELGQRTSAMARFAAREVQSALWTATDAVMETLDESPSWQRRAKRLKQRVLLSGAWHATKRRLAETKTGATKLASLGAKRGSAKLVDLAISSLLSVGKWAGGDMIAQDHLLFLVVAVALVTRGGLSSVLVSLAAVRIVRKLTERPPDGPARGQPARGQPARGQPAQGQPAKARSAFADAY